MKRLLWVAGIFFCAALSAEAQSKPLAISVKKLYVGDGTVVDNAVVLVKDGKIVAAGAGIAIPDDAEKTAFANATMTPGLIDASSAAGLPGVEAEHRSEVTPEFRVLDAVDLGHESFETLVKEGVTTVGLHGDTGSVIGGQGTVLKTGSDGANRVVVKSGSIRATFNHDPQGRGMRNGPPFGQMAQMSSRRPGTQMGTIFVFRESFHRAIASRDQAAVDKNAKMSDVDRILVDVIERRRQLWGVGDMYHEILAAVNLSNEISDTLELKGDDRLRVVVDGGAEAWRLIDELKRARASVVFGPMASPAMATRRRQYGQAVDPDLKLSTPALLAGAGITTALTAAGGVGENGLARQAGMAMRYGLDRGLAIAAVTSIPAKLLGVSDRVGAIKPGMDADFVIWSGEPFDATSRQEAVFLNGKKVAAGTY